MPNKKSAMKDLRQSKVRAERNTLKKDAFKAIAKKIRVAITDNKADVALKLFNDYTKAVDKAAKTNVIHKNTASRKKSRMSKRILSASKK